MAGELRRDNSVVLIFPILWAMFGFYLSSHHSAHADQTVAETHYVLYCSGCHRQDGRGSLKGRIPDFINSIGHIAKSADGRSYIARVPGVKNSGMNAHETASVLNYVLDRFGGDDATSAHYNEAEVQRYWTLPETDIVAMRDYVCSTSVKEGCSSYPWKSADYNLPK